MAIAWCITQTTDGGVGCTFLVEVDTHIPVRDVLALLLAASHLVLSPVAVCYHGRSTTLFWAELRLEEEPFLWIRMQVYGRHMERVTDGGLHIMHDGIHMCRRQNGQPSVCG